MREIALANGRGFALVDDEDYDKLSAYKWSLSNCGYARRAVSVKNRYVGILMHRQVIGAIRGQAVDHIDGNSLNNTRKNLRLCTHAGNLANRGVTRTKVSSRFKGVYPTQSGRRWRAMIKVNYRIIGLGCFDAETDAAHAYDAAAAQHFGEFARLNFPDSAA